MTLILRILGVSLVLSQLTGCVAGGSGDWGYPGNWPPRVATDSPECPDISGQYANLNTGVSGAPPSTLLYDVIANDETFFGNRCVSCKVEISWLDENHRELSIALRPEVTEPQAGDESEKKVLSRTWKDFTCADGALTLPVAHGFTILVAGFIDLGKSRWSLADDGSLVAEQEFTRAGYLTVMPVGGKFVTYARWERRSEEPKQE